MAAPAPARTVRAARPAPNPAAPRRRPAPQPRPRLRLVDDARLKAAQRRRRTRLVVVAAGFLVTGLLFALAAFNAFLVSGQGRLDQLERDVAEAQSLYSANRLKVAELESPEHIVRAAQERLGMIPPGEVNWLAPSEEMAAQAGAAGQVTETIDGGDGTSWAAAKPYLSATRP